jgi:hypothetical protein
MPPVVAAFAKYCTVSFGYRFITFTTWVLGGYQVKSAPGHFGTWLDCLSFYIGIATSKISRVYLKETHLMLIKMLDVLNLYYKYLFNEGN